MMKIDKSLVEHVAALAKLQPDEEETIRLLADMEKILGYIEMISRLDLNSIEPTSYAIPIQCPLRKDEVEKGLSLEEALSNAPDRLADLVRVPVVIE